MTIVLIARVEEHEDIESDSDGDEQSMNMKGATMMT